MPEIEKETLILMLILNEVKQLASDKKWWKLWEKQDCQKLKDENMNYSQFCTLGNEPSKTCRKGSMIHGIQMGGCCLIIEM